MTAGKPIQFDHMRTGERSEISLIEIIIKKRRGIAHLKDWMGKKQMGRKMALELEVFQR